MESKTKVKMTKDMGRGVFATKNLSKYTVIESSPCITWSKTCNDAIQETELRFYVFEGKSKTHSVLALGVGSLFNHSKKSNVTYRYDEKRNVVKFMATRKILKGEQLFIDYGYDPVQQYNNWTLQKLRDSAEKEELIEKAASNLDESIPTLPVGLSNQLPGSLPTVHKRPADYQLVDCRDCMRGCDDCKSYCEEFGIVPEEHPEPIEKEEPKPSLLKRILGFLEGLVGGH